MADYLPLSRKLKCAKISDILSGDIYKDNEIVLTFADGHEEVMGPYSLHNMNFYRYRVQRQFYEFYDKYMNEMALESFKVCVKKFGSVALSLAGLFFMYNFDIHIIIKILLTLGVAA